MKSTFFAQGLNNLSLDEKAKSKEGTICLVPPPPPPGPLSPVSPVQKSPSSSPKSSSILQSIINTTAIDSTIQAPSSDSQSPVMETSSQETVEDDFGDFQAAG